MVTQVFDEPVVVVVVEVEPEEPPGGMQIGVHCQMELQSRKLLAALISAAVNPYLAPIVVQVSETPAT